MEYNVGIGGDINTIWCFSYFWHRFQVYLWENTQFLFGFEETSNIYLKVDNC